MSRISTDPSYPPVPMCESNPASSQSAPPPYAPPPPPAAFAALTADETGALYGSYSYPTGEQAKAASLASCKKGGGKACYFVGGIGRAGTIGGLLFPQTGDVMATVIDGENRYFASAGLSSTDDRTGAIRRAFALCISKSRVGRCLLTGIFLPNGEGANFLTITEVRTTLFGNDPKAQNRLTQNEAQALGSNFETFSLRMNALVDTREYWGAIASDARNEGINGAYNQPTEAEARAMALHSCKGKGCKIVQTFHNTCLGQAWPDGKRAGLEVASHAEPSQAKADALAQCTAKYGSCQAAVRCSGSVYASFNPEAAGAGAEAK